MGNHPVEPNRIDGNAFSNVVNIAVFSLYGAGAAYLLALIFSSK